MKIITGQPIVDAHLEKMVLADERRDFEVAHSEEDIAQSQMLVLLAEERATPGQAAAMIKFLHDYHRTPPIPMRWYA